jgi:hypothetical protein
VAVPLSKLSRSAVQIIRYLRWRHRFDSYPSLQQVMKKAVCTGTVITNYLCGVPLSGQRFSELRNQDMII